MLAAAVGAGVKSVVLKLVVEVIAIWVILPVQKSNIIRAVTSRPIQSSPECVLEEILGRCRTVRERSGGAIDHRYSDGGQRLEAATFTHQRFRGFGGGGDPGGISAVRGV